VCDRGAADARRRLVESIERGEAKFARVMGSCGGPTARRRPAVQVSKAELVPEAPELAEEVLRVDPESLQDVGVLVGVYLVG
jgi:hypothetical protein